MLAVKFFGFESLGGWMASIFALYFYVISFSLYPFLSVGMNRIFDCSGGVAYAGYTLGRVSSGKDEV